jgi:hypothetical protein
MKVTIFERIPLSWGNFCAPNIKHGNPLISIVTGHGKGHLLLEGFLCLRRAVILGFSLRRIVELVHFEANRVLSGLLLKTPASKIWHTLQY